MAALSLSNASIRQEIRGGDAPAAGFPSQQESTYNENTHPSSRNCRPSPSPSWPWSPRPRPAPRKRRPCRPPGQRPERNPAGGRDRHRLGQRHAQDRHELLDHHRHRRTAEASRAEQHGRRPEDRAGRVCGIDRRPVGRQHRGARLPVGQRLALRLGADERQPDLPGAGAVLLRGLVGLPPGRHDRARRSAARRPEHDLFERPAGRHDELHHEERRRHAGRQPPLHRPAPAACAASTASTAARSPTAGTA